jgi:multidrug efflux pump subunit AcrA (membrane-fusion protein)
MIYTVREEIFRNVIEIAGNIEAAQQQNIQAAGDGTVEAVYVKEGDRVKEGQILFQLDDSLERFNLANHDFQMNQERISGASGRIALMDKQREVLLKNIGDRRLEARFDGVIGKLTLAGGDYAKAQDIFGYLIDRSYLKATVEVVETDASRLKAGQRVALDFPAYPDLKVEGTVLSYPAVGRITSRGATVLDTEIRIDNPPEEILPGYSFTGEIIGGEPERILTVESAAIAYENGRAYVERIARGSPRGRPGEGNDRGNPQARSSEGVGPGGESGRGNPPARSSEGNGPGSGGDRPAPVRPAGASGRNNDGNSGPAGGNREPPAPVEDGPPERVDVEAAPYGRNMVRILSGLEPGDRLKAQAQGQSGGFSPGRRGGGAIRIGR